MIFEHRTLDNNYNLYSLLNIKKYMRVKNTKQDSGLYSIFFAMIFFFLKKKKKCCMSLCQGGESSILKNFSDRIAWLSLSSNLFRKELGVDVDVSVHFVSFLISRGSFDLQMRKRTVRKKKKEVGSTVSFLIDSLCLKIIRKSLIWMYFEPRKWTEMRPKMI